MKKNEIEKWEDLPRVGQLEGAWNQLEKDRQRLVGGSEGLKVHLWWDETATRSQ
jgi:hypothetical protein